MMSINTERITRLDVRPILAVGDEPFTLIMKTSSGVPDGGTLEVLAPFEPVPLYHVMTERGFVAREVSEAEGTWTVRFTRADLTPASTIGEVFEHYPETAPVFEAHGMDLCCGGHLSLDDAAQAHAVDLGELTRALAQAIAGRPVR